MSIDSEPEIIFKWTNLCRLCLSSDSHIDLFSSEVISQDCLSKIRSCLNLLVYCGDPMPSKLCSSCHIKLDEWCKFRNECIQSESNVKKRLQPYKDIKFVKEYFERCAKFESSEIVSSSSKPNTNSVQAVEEVNSSVSTQEHEGENHQDSELERPSLKRCLSPKPDADDFKSKLSKLDDGFGRPIHQDNSTEKKDWVGNESGLLGTIVSVTGSASALWETQHQNKQAEDSNYFYSENSERIKANQYDYEKTCSNCGSHFATQEEFDSHGCCIIGSSTHLEEDGEDEGHFEDSISFESDYDGNENYSIEDHLGVGPVHPVAKVKITPWKCLACKLYFQSSFNLRRHYYSITCLGKKVRALDCEFCFRQFLSLNDLLEHQVVHIGIRLELTEDDLICCGQCALLFPDERRLRNHLLVHRLKRKAAGKHACSQCSEVFFQRESYESHLLTHGQMQNDREATPEAEAEPDFELEPDPEPGEAASPPHEAPTGGATPETQSPEEPKKPQGAVRCFRCGQMFASVKQLEHHEAIKHKNPTPYICRKCCLRFSARSQLLMHLRVHMSKTSSKASPNESNEQTNSCTVCDAKFLLESDLESHMKTHKLPGSEPSSPTGPPTPTEETENSDVFVRYKCSLCSRVYLRAASCIRHGQQSHKGQKVVPVRLKRTVLLGRRTSLPAGGKVKHKCPKCPKYFFSFNAFSVHAYRNHGLKMANPSEEAANPEAEENPESPKADEGESKCPFCSKDIKPSYISLHIKKFHRGEVLDPAMIKKDIPTDSCICRYCFKTCSTPHNRKLHESIHYPVKAQRNQCETCGQKFGEKAAYEDHVRTCKSIRCGKCHKIFFKFINLAQHACTGTKSDESHKCTVCLSAFTSLDLLQIHIKNFHGKKPDQGTPQPGTSRNSGKRLERELWREEANKIVCMVGEKFYCTFCDCEFSTVQESNEHRAAHPRGNWYAVQISDSLFQCTICDKFFETRKSSLLHINYHKKNLLPEQPKPFQGSSLVEPEVEIVTTDVTRSGDAGKAKRYNCRYCSAGFRDSEDLQDHIFHSHVNQT